MTVENSEQVETTSDDQDFEAFEQEFFGVTKETDADEDSGNDDNDAPAPESDDESPDPNASEEEDADEGEEDDDPQPEVKGRRKTAKDRINELTAKAREAERREEALRAEFEALKAKLESSPTDDKKDTPAADTPTALAALDADAPDPDATLENGQPKYPLGEFDPTYIRDLTRYTIAKEAEAAKAAEAKAKEEAEMEAAEKALVDSWQEKLVKAEETLPELRERAAGLEHTFRNLDPSYGTYLASTIMSMEYGPEVLDYLGGNIAEAQRIVESGPTAATIALGRLEARFAMKAEGEKRKGRTTSAPPPPRQQTRGSGGRFAVADDTDDLDAFEQKFFSKR